MAGFEVTLYGRIWVTPKDPLVFYRDCGATGVGGARLYGALR